MRASLIILAATMANASVQMPSLIRRIPSPRRSSTPTLFTPGPFSPRAENADSSSKLSGAAAVPLAKGFRSNAWFLPTVSYSGLGFTIAGAIRLLGMNWMSTALMGWTVALPVSFALFACSQGGAKVAESMGGKPADATLTEYAREAAKAVGVPPPEAVFEIPAREPNAFAASNLWAGSSTVAVTSGLRSALTANELKAVLAHEMGHLQYNDVVRNMHISVAAAGLGGVYQAGRILLDSSSRDRKKDKDDSGSGAGAGLALMAAGLATQATAHFVRLSASRSSEFKADAAAARAFGADTMISALKKIDSTAASQPADLRNNKAASAYAFAMISDGASTDMQKVTRSSKVQKSNLLTKVGNALRTHPPLPERVAALEDAAEKGHVPASMRKGGIFF